MQDSERAITDIDIRVRQISTIARQHYSQSELVALDVLEQKTEETIRLMGDLKNQLRCEPIFRYIYLNVLLF